MPEREIKQNLSELTVLCVG